jgi:hypothetical protein
VAADSFPLVGREAALAAVAGHWSTAERHLTVALRQLAARRAHSWTTLTRHTLATVLAATQALRSSA